MDLAFDLLQASGIAAAIGIRPFLPVLLVGALATADLGIDFDGTDFSFLEQPPLFAMSSAPPPRDLLGAPGRARGARVRPPWAAGLAAGATVARAAGHGLAGRPRRSHRGRRGGRGRRDGAGDRHRAPAVHPCAQPARQGRRRDARPCGDSPPRRWRSRALSVLFPPLAALVIAARSCSCSFGGQRREGEKYAGLRIRGEQAHPRRRRRDEAGDARTRDLDWQGAGDAG